ncbi:THAP domain-containing protein 2-like isoform X2 [Onychostoma macrolepis]|uniref:THAP domain-containing protein 2-like isoform X2 n=1 Tax=Onychostoma macrolepis TaxID=369639 RepID=UPI00272D94E2|nr:THAP domain-containing protein 2-like isoform X2 [Onychostoma macrolepis]
MYCCVPLCDTSSRFNSVVSFHTFPLDKETSKKWIHYIRREDFNITPNTRVCSRHFKSDDLIEPSTPTERRLLKKGAVPTLFEWNNYSTSAPRRTGAWQRREVSPPLNEDPVPVDLQHEEHDYCSFPVPAAVDLSLDQTEDLRKEVEQLRKQVEELSVRHRFCLGRFAASDDDIRFYTRFVTYNHLMAFWRLIEPASHNMVRVTRARAATTRSEGGASGNASGETTQVV